MKNTEARIADAKSILQEGLDSLTSGEDWKAYLEFAAVFHDYSFNNTMMIFSQRPDATRVAGAGQVRLGKPTGWAALGRVPAAGAQKIWIWAPYVKKSGEGDDEKSAVRFILVPVYEVADTEGDPLPEHDAVRLLEGSDDAGLLKKALEFIEHIGFTYQFVPSIPGSPANGDVNPVSSHIRICTEGRDEAQQAKTALHEAAHAVLHCGGKGISVPREQKEVEAESTAFVVSHCLGADTSSYSFGYVAGWAAETGFTARTAVKHSGKRIQHAASRMIRFIEGDVTGDDGAEEE